MKNKHLFIKYLAAITLYLFCPFIPEQAQAQSTETAQVEGCSLELTENEIIIAGGSGNQGCNFKYKLRDKKTEYSIAFNIIPDDQSYRTGAKESSVYVFDSNGGKVYEQKVGFTAGTAIQSLTVSLKNLYEKNQASLVIEDRVSGMGSCGAGDLDITVYDQNLPDKLYRLGEGILKGGSQDGGFSQCTEFKDIDNNGIIEIVTSDTRFYYAFGERTYLYPPQIIALTPNGFQDVTLNYPDFLRTEAKHSWDEVITRRQEVSNSCPNYFSEIGNYAAIKSMLGEYPDAIRRIEERINMDLAFHRLYNCYQPYIPADINTFIPDLEAVLSENGYI
ncbi:MAG: hypothetical protein ACFCU7_09625 [Pleurocapsa sp.]